METWLYGPTALVITKLAKSLFFVLFPKRSFHMKQFKNIFEWMGTHWLFARLRQIHKNLKNL